jgi:hypothetical protein
MEDQFYNYELGKFSVSLETEFQINNVVRTRNKVGIKQHLLKWKCYHKTFNSWVNAFHINKV